MSINEWAAILCLLLMAAFSAFLGHRFGISSDKSRLKTLLTALFYSKTWMYFATMVSVILGLTGNIAPVESLPYVILIVNVPTLVVKALLIRNIRNNY